MNMCGREIGYKFETLSTLPAPWGETSRDYIEGRENEVVSNKAQYCSIVRTGVSGKPVLCLGGEVDARRFAHAPLYVYLARRGSYRHNADIDAMILITAQSVWDSRPPPGEPINWVELKTSAEIRNGRDMANFERKLMRFWIQSFLLGVPRIIVGFRTQDGILCSLEEIKTETIPHTAKRPGSQAGWDGNVCINFMGSFIECKFFSRLSLITITLIIFLNSMVNCVKLIIFHFKTGLKQVINDEGVWRIRRKPGASNIEVFRIEETGHGRILTDEFINWRIKLSLGPSPPVQEEG